MFLKLIASVWQRRARGLVQRTLDISSRAAFLTYIIHIENIFIIIGIIKILTFIYIWD